MKITLGDNTVQPLEQTALLTEIQHFKVFCKNVGIFQQKST